MLQTMPAARDPHRPSSHFLQYIADCDEDRDWYLETMANEENDRAAQLRMHGRIARNSIHVVQATYSAGLGRGDIRGRVVEAIGAIEAFYGVGLQDEKGFFDREKGIGAISFDLVYTLLGAGVVFDLDKTTMAPLADAIAAMRRNGRMTGDALTDRFLGYFDLSDDTPADDLIFAEAYKPLDACFDLQAELRPAQLAMFLEGWYAACKTRAFPWYGLHKKDPSNIYPGYWRFEAAAVAKILGIDDSALNDNPFYPYAALPR